MTPEVLHLFRLGGNVVLQGDEDRYTQSPGDSTWRGEKFVWGLWRSPDETMRMARWSNKHPNATTLECIRKFWKKRYTTVEL